MPGDNEAWVVEAESGALLREVARRTVEQALEGLEWATGIPGTVGGAVVGNAGAYGGYVSDCLTGAMVLSPDEGERWWVSKELRLGYRSSTLKKGRKDAGFEPVVLSASFTLRRGDIALIRERVAECSRRRAERQPEGLSAGSVFKRTAQYPAGFLIENTGLKGKRVGGAVVSPKHANFIVNLGTATAMDVQELIELVRREVYEAFKITLELEIELVGDW
jgi:UDP-N-acetylmuramate dehydrogenase